MSSQNQSSLFSSRSAVRRRRLGGFAVGAACAVGVVGDTRAQATFSIVALPDTQNYVTSSTTAPNFTAQTQWIADEIELFNNPRNISFVTHLGDMVSSGNSVTQYNRADISMRVLDGVTLDGVVPYGVLPGNHDFASTGSKTTGTDLYKSFFGPQRFTAASWYGGADPSGNNSFQLFNGGGTTYLHIALEWRPDLNITNGPQREPSPIDWAQRVISDHPGVPTIISSHEHLDDEPAGRSTSGESVWNLLVRRNDQIIMVLNGHYHSAGGTNDGEYHQVSTNDFGKPVIEALQDFQGYPNGGDGWLRIITFDPASNEIGFETYSPVLDQFQTESIAEVGQFASEFAIPFDFAERFAFAPPPTPPEPPREVFETLIIAQGVDGYTGTLDKEVRSSGDDSTNGSALEVSIDGDDGSPGLQPTDALLQFGGIFGAGPGQVAAADVTAAFLRLTISNPGSGFDLFRMSTPWDETTTWSDLGGDGITPGVEAAFPVLAQLGEDASVEAIGTGPLRIDVTPTVKAWAAGADNFGFGLLSLPDGTNGIDFTSSESGSPPAIEIRTPIPTINARAFVQDVDGYTGAVDTELVQASPTSRFDAGITISIDASSGGGPRQGLIRFDGIFGAGPGMIGPADEVARALLTIDAFDAGDGARVHRLLQSFRVTSTWSNSFGADGVQADGVEAVEDAEAVVPGAAARVEIDVTESIRAWQADPRTNLGWVFLPLGSNGWDFSSSDDVAQFRPALTVYVDTCPPDLVTPFDGQPNAADIEAFLALGTEGLSRADWDAAGETDFFDLLSYLRDHDAGCSP